MTTDESPHAPEQGAPHRSSDAAAFLETALIALGLALLLLSEKHRINGDGVTRHLALRLLFERGELSDMPFSIVGPLFASPFYALDRLTGSPMWWSERFNFFVFMLGLILLYRLLAPHLERGVVRKFILLLVIGSMFPRHQLDFYGEVFTAVLAAVGLLALSRRDSAWGWLALLLAVANTPATGLGLVLASAALALERMRWRYLLLPVAAAILVLGEAWIRRGSPFATGYEGNAGLLTVLPYSGRPGFSYPFVLGVLSILLSFGKGLAFYAPGLLVPVKRRALDLGGELWGAYRLWVLFLAGMVVAYAKWWSWYGGWYWGPRFFLFASVPASFALAIAVSSRWRSPLANALVMLALLVSVYGGVNGFVFEQYGLDACTADEYALESLCWYVPELSPLYHPFVDAKPLTSEDYTLIAYAAAVFLWLAASPARDLLSGLKDRATEVRDRLRGGVRF